MLRERPAVALAGVATVVVCIIVYRGVGRVAWLLGFVSRGHSFEASPGHVKALRHSVCSPVTGSSSTPRGYLDSFGGRLIITVSFQTIGRTDRPATQKLTYLRGSCSGYELC